MATNSNINEYPDQWSAISAIMEKGYTVWVSEAHRDLLNHGYLASISTGLANAVFTLHRVAVHYEWHTQSCQCGRPNRKGQ